VDFRISRTAAVIVQVVPPEEEAWFLDWQHGIAAAAAKFPGYRGTDVHPPAGGRQGEWVVIVHFLDESFLRIWLESPEREAWLTRYRDRLGSFDLHTPSGGFGPWFAGLARGTSGPPTWKMALTVLLALYPTVMLLVIFVSPFTSRFGVAVSMLIGNALSVSILQWGVMPLLRRGLTPWLGGDLGRSRRGTLAGTAAIVLALAGLAALFRQVTS
jgi:antibiotic biosynthesis monooxygenase (ABM) superfamily enzyme